MTGFLKQLWRFGELLAYIFEVYAENATQRKNELEVQAWSDTYFDYKAFEQVMDYVGLLLLCMDF